MADTSSFEQIKQLNNRVEMPKAAERAVESTPAPTQVASPRPVQRVPVTVNAPSAAPVAKTRADKSEALRKIEHVLESDLHEVYKKMPPDLQQSFRKRGEDTAVQVEVLLQKVKVQTKKIFQLLFAWLKIIPGVNQYFLEQEAKLKTDELLRLKEDLDKTHGRSSGL